MTGCAVELGGPYPKTGIDPLGLGVNTARYMFWLFNLQEGPPLHVD